MFDQWEVVTLAGSDLERRDVDLGEEVGGRPGEGRGDVDEPLRLGVLLQIDLLVGGERALRHDVPDRHVGVGWDDGLGVLGHLVLDEMGLVLDDLTARRGRRVDHRLGDLE